jgi:hypothetical protein
MLRLDEGNVTVWVTAWMAGLGLATLAVLSLLGLATHHVQLTHVADRLALELAQARAQDHSGCPSLSAPASVKILECTDAGAEITVVVTERVRLGLFSADMFARSVYAYSALTRNAASYP